jgi:hypothetical protein
MPQRRHSCFCHKAGYIAPMEGQQRQRTKAEVQRLESLAAWWAEQAAHIERDRLQLRWFYWGGGPAAALVGFGWDWRAGLGILGLAALAWIQGTWLCQVHRLEYAYNLREARRDLWQSRKALLRSQRTKVGGSRSVSHLPPHPLAQASAATGEVEGSVI